MDKTNMISECGSTCVIKLFNRTHNKYTHTHTYMHTLPFLLFPCISVLSLESTIMYNPFLLMIRPVRIKYAAVSSNI